MPTRPKRKPYGRRPRGHFTGPAVTWRQERVLRLARICRDLDRQLKTGKKSIKKLLRFRVWSYKGQRYTSAPRRKINFSYCTILRAYARWKKSGRNPDSLALKYKTPTKKVSPADLARLLRGCACSGCVDLIAAFRHARPHVAHLRSYRRELERRRLARRVWSVFYHRRLARVAARKLIGIAAELEKPA